MAVNDAYTTHWVPIKHAGTGGVTEIPPESMDHYRSLGWAPVAESAPTSKATLAELQQWATAKDPENAEAIAASTKAELLEQYGS